MSFGRKTRCVSSARDTAPGVTRGTDYEYIPCRAQRRGVCKAHCVTTSKKSIGVAQVVRLIMQRSKQQNPSFLTNM